MDADAISAAGRTPPGGPPSGDSGRRRVIIRTVKLRKEYVKKTVRTEALRGIDVEIYAGEFISVMGPSGSGKSTFFNMVGGLDSPTSGRVFIDEVDVAQLTAVELAFLRCRKIGYIFQEYNLIQYMTALENVTAPMAFGGVDPDAARERGMSLLEIVGLADRWSHRPIEMSGGQQQRVAIARALANSPSIILADEPTANLDLATGEEIINLLSMLCREDGVTVITATHDHKMLSTSDRIVWMRDGRIDEVELRSDLDIRVGSIT